MSIDPRLFRQVMGQFATGVTIVTTSVDGLYHGMTANAVTSVSLSPTLILVCVDNRARTRRYVEEAGAFAVSILSEDQQNLSVYFAGPRDEGPNELEGIPYRLGETGSPIIEGALGYLDCRLVAAYPGGDHTIFVGEVVDADFTTGRLPLIYHRSRYARLQPAALTAAVND